MSTQWKRRSLLQSKSRKNADSKCPVLLTDECKEQIRTGSYLGKKGYTIPRELLSESELEFLHKDLLVKPETVGPAYGMPGAQDECAFPVYRENDKKIYIPRFYGIDRYGLPDRSEITRGEDISVTFAKPLRDYQDNIVDVYMNHSKQAICGGSSNIGNGGILEVPCGRGKCLGKNTQILMFDGSIKLVQDVCIGDLLMGDDSTPRTVLTLARGREMMYKVNEFTRETSANAYASIQDSNQLENSSGYIVNESHILSLKYKQHENIVDLSVKEYIKHVDQEKLCGYRVPIHFPKLNVRSNPYVMGIWLCKINTGDHYLSDEFIHYNVCKHDPRIPHEFKCNTQSIRLNLLAGIIDYGGNYHENRYECTFPHRPFTNDIVFLARSLGYSAHIRTTENACNTRTNYTVVISGTGLDKIPVKNIYKTFNFVSKSEDVSRRSLLYPIQLEPIGIDDYYGFEIDGNRRFVLGDLTVTHNTVMALKIISLVQKKTLIIVHKEFLMNQWIDRAAEFLPGAKIGKIQASTFDVEGKDIVIGMLQTLYDRALPENAFDCFGLTIVDEVHRIGSEQFSKTLLRVVSPNMLGISATVDRKDKLTKVLYMFIGPKIYTESRNSDDPVCVRALEYISSDPQFNETEYDFRGQAKYSTMISKLCEFGPRSDFIVRVLADLVKEGREREQDPQIMVLCHNRSLLKYFYEAIQHRGFATVGYYVGGMKQSALQETEEKQIVLATYAMAAEALDIKTLSVLLMATPKTDITQSIGRILRVRHDNPIVVDIVDRHDVFQNQWRQRKTFYRKCNYRILAMDSVRYQGMSLDWKVDKTWSKVFEPRISNANSDETPVTNKKCMISIADLDISDEV